jgi:hypothetical protein
MPPGKPLELCVGPFAVVVLLKACTGVVTNLNGNTDWPVEAGAEMVTEEAGDTAMMAEVVVMGAVLEVVRFTAGCRPPTVGAAFSFTPFVQLNLKTPGELTVLLLVAVFK